MNGEQILAWAKLIDVEAPSNSNGQNINLKCPYARLGDGHSGLESSRRCFSVLVNEFGPSLTYCFGCGKRGTVLGTSLHVNKHTGGQFEEAVAYAKKHDAPNIGRSLDRLRKRVRGLDEGTHSSIPKSVFKMYVATAGKCPRYILNRGITLKEAKQWRIGYDSKEYRATFPVWDHMGELVGITGRAIYPNAVAKYRMYHGFDARKYLYGEHKLDVTRRSCILVEGQIDAIVLSRYYPNVMAVLGLSMTQERVTKLKAWFEDVTLMLDNDAAGRGAAQRFQKDVHGVVRLFAAWLPEKVDPKAATYEQLKEAMSKRKLVGLSL